MDYTELDNAICEHLRTKKSHPTDSTDLCSLAQNFTNGIAGILIDRRLQAMRKSGRIVYEGEWHVG